MVLFQSVPTEWGGVIGFTVLAFAADVPSSFLSFLCEWMVCRAGSAEGPGRRPKGTVDVIFIILKDFGDQPEGELLQNWRIAWEKWDQKSQA